LKLNWAERWVVNNPSRVWQQRLELAWMKRQRPLPKGATVLEIGCGRGAGAGLLSRAFRPKVFHATDLDLGMLRRAERYLRGAARQGIRLSAADALHLPCRDACLDAVFGFGVLHHVPDWRGAAREVARVLKPGGTYYLEELYPTLYQNALTKHVLLHPTVDRFRSDDLAGEMSAAGLHRLAARELRGIGILAIYEKRASAASECGSRGGGERAT